MLKRTAEIAGFRSCDVMQLQRILEQRKYLLFPHAASIGGCWGHKSLRQGRWQADAKGDSKAESWRRQALEPIRRTTSPDMT